MARITTRKRRIPLGGFIIASLGLLLCVSWSLAVLAVTDSVRTSAALDAARRGIEVGDLRAARSALTGQGARGVLDGFVSEALGNSEAAVLVAPELLALVDSTKARRANRLREAAENLEAMCSLAHYSSDPVCRVDRKATIKAADALAGLAERIETEELLLSEVKAKRDAVIVLYRSVATRFGALLSLQPQAADPSKHLVFYERGFLAGLPALVGLEDGIGDVDTLAERLPRIGGKVTVTGPNPAAVFSSELDAVRSLSSPLLRDEDAFFNELTGRTASIKEARSSYERESSKVLQFAARCLAETSHDANIVHRALDKIQTIVDG